MAVQDPNVLLNQARQQVRAAYPDASTINVPDPGLVYYVDDAAVEQRILEPVLEFNGIEVTIVSETFILRGITLPLFEGGSGGSGPSVRIIAPSGGSRLASGANVALRGEVRDGAVPYRVEWLNGEGDVIRSTTLNSPGDVTVTTNNLPAGSRDGTPEPTTVTLRVTDNDGVVRQDRITLIPFNPLHLPLITRGGRGAAPGSAGSERIADIPLAPQSTGYSFSIESVSDYPPTGVLNLPGDLPGVIPDASGFREGMLRYGYTRRFSWNEGLAWERDWRDCALGGIDCTVGVDRADFVYFAGHGGRQALCSPLLKTTAGSSPETPGSRRCAGLVSRRARCCGSRVLQPEMSQSAGGSTHSRVRIC